MKTLNTYLECNVATPANTMGMGNPGEIGPDTLSEPIHTAKAEKEKIVIDEPERKKKKKKHVKSLAESLFDKDLTKQNVYIGDVYDLEDCDIFGTNKLEDAAIVKDSFSDKSVWNTIAKPTWNNFLKRFNFQSKYYAADDQYDHDPDEFYFFEVDLFYVLTWIVFCCTGYSEIKEKTTALLKSIKPEHGLKQINKVEVYMLDYSDDRKMIQFKFKTKERDIVFNFIINRKK